MNENINLVEILKDCPKGTKLYSPLSGEVVFHGIENDPEYPIRVFREEEGKHLSFTKKGLYHIDAPNGECLLFPSKDVRTWDNFKPKKPKFDPNTLKPFDKVLVQCNKSESWKVQLFSHIIEDEALYPYACVAYNYEYCIPYNDDTKHLVGTSEEAPEYYRYWED